MAKKAWTAFPYPDPRFDLAGDRLAKAWKDLHAGDLEPFPDEKRVAALLGGGRKGAPDAKATAYSRFLTRL